jgi:hypothetical protein
MDVDRIVDEDKDSDPNKVKKKYRKNDDDYLFINLAYITSAT